MRTLGETLKELRESRAHTYASENADRYRGFDAGQQRAAESLAPVQEALWALRYQMENSAFKGVPGYGDKLEAILGPRPERKGEGT